ncbi:MAG: hypothetical protein RLZZ10_452, partial [Pseudomonadota bacterium]
NISHKQVIINIMFKRYGRIDDGERHKSDS